MPNESGNADATSADAQTPADATSKGQADAGRDARSAEHGERALGDAGKEALDRERTARREAEKRASDAERQLTSLQDAGKSELEKAISRLDRASAELETERATRTRLEQELASRDVLELKRTIAADLGVPLEAAHRLQGDDSRSIKADAQRYLDERAQSKGEIGVGAGGGASRQRTGADMNRLIREASGRQ